MKICKTCKTEQPLTNFHKEPRTKDGLKYSCKPCSSKINSKWYKANKHLRQGYRYKTKYGITLAERDLMLKTQEGRCFICKDETELVVDHCHKSGKVRALLCSHCNIGLGMFRDNPKFTQSATQYLEMFKHHGY